MRFFRFTVLALVVTLVITTYYYSHPLTDWIANYRPAALGLFTGHLYDVGVFNPPHLFVILYPFALLPARAGNAIIAAVGACVLIYTLTRLGASPWLAVLVALMPQNIHVFMQGSIDWLITLGYVLPARWGLFLVLAKPQIGIGVAIYWFFQAWREGGIRKVYNTFWPVSLAYGLGILAYGLQAAGVGRFDMILSGSVGHHTNLWPYALPVGLGILALAIQHHRLGWAALASPLMAPYVARYTMPYAVTLGLVPDVWPTVMSVVGWWAVFIIRPEL